MKGADPVFQMGATGRGVLLLHGFTGTPNEMKYLGKRLSDEGFSVMIPRLPGHGTTIAEMTRTTGRDWLLAAREAFIDLQSCCADVSCVGLSMGGILSLLLAREFPIKRLVLLSTPASLPGYAIYLAPLLSPFVKVLPKIDEKKGLNSLEARSYHICYNEGIPVRQAWHLHGLIRKAFAALPAVSSETLLIQSLGDEYIPPDSIHRIYERLGSARKEKIFLDISNHTITVDYEKDYVAEEVARFLSS
jgi:carboxylesterase